MKRWNAGDSLFWFTFVGLSVAGFIALVAITALILSIQPMTQPVATPSPAVMPNPSPTPDLSACDRLPYDSSQQYDCFRDAAVSSKDATICDAPSISGWKPLCLLAVAEVMTDETVCSYFETHYTTFMDDCLVNVAIARKDTTWCGTIQDQRQHDECFKKIALAAYQPELCVPISDPQDRDGCVYTIATQLLDGTMCDGIAGPEKNLRASGTLTIREDSLCNRDISIREPPSHMEILDDILDTDLSEEAIDIGNHLLDTGAAIAGPVAIAGIVFVGVKKIVDSFGE